MEFLLTSFLLNHRKSGLEVFDAAGNVRIVARTAGVAVAVVIHGPDVVTIGRKYVHQRIFTLPWQGEVVAGARRVRGAMDQEEDRPRGLAGSRRAHSLAEKIESHVALMGPIFVAPDVGLCALGRCRRLGLRRSNPRGKTGSYAKAGPLYDCTACNRMVGHDVFLRSARPSGGGRARCCSPRRWLIARIADCRADWHTGLGSTGRSGAPMGPSAALALAGDIC